jgi:hypothetical protein
LYKPFSPVRNFKKGFVGEVSSPGYTGRTSKGFVDFFILFLRLWTYLDAFDIFGTFLGGFGKTPIFLQCISAIHRYLMKSGYRNVLPRSTHMLTSENKQRRIQWAQQHQNYDFTHTVFTDETSLQIFRNTVRRCTKCPNNESKRILKNRQKVHMWGAISVRGVLSCHTFRCNLDGSYYVHILKNYLLPAAKQEFHQKWCLQQDTDPKHTSNIFKQFINNKVPRLLE